MRNLALMTDSYKLTHHNQYPQETEKIFSYFESRVGSKYPGTLWNGLQSLLKQIEGCVITKEDVDYAENFTNEHISPNIFNRKMWDIVVNEHGGRLPIIIKSAPEGSLIPTGNVLMTIENTDERCYALTNHLETWLCQLWYPCNVATIGHFLRKKMEYYLKTTSDKPEAIDFMLHDFGMRGTSSMESAAIGGAAHLINFKGTDTTIAIEHIRKHYGVTEMPAFSVPATEHSVMTILGKDGEFEQVDRLLDMYPKGILSVVSDSFDIFNACRIYGTRFKERILNRKGKFVVRPDSGDPVNTTIEVLDILGEFFGSKSNSKSYRELPPQIGVLWGDGIGPDGIEEILREMKNHGWAADNIVFGMGGGLLQKHNRDTQKFAFKCSAAKINGEWRDVFKNPVNGNKKSKKGRLILTKTGSVYHTDVEGCGRFNILETVFENGEIKRFYDFNEIRANARQ